MRLLPTGECIFHRFVSFRIFSATLNGELELRQNGTARSTSFISSGSPLNQSIQINAQDFSALKNATYVTTYWFVDCQYVGQSESLSAIKHFNDENSTHSLEALVVASFEPRPQPTPSTTTTTTTTPKTTTTSTTTSTTPLTTTSTSTTTPKPTTTGKPSRMKRDLSQQSQQVVKILSANNGIDYRNIVNGSEELVTHPTETMTIADEIQQPYVCFNKSQVAPDPKKIYGYFMRDFTVKSRKYSHPTPLFADVLIFHCLSLRS